MAVLLSRLDFYEIGRRVILTRARKIDPAEVDVEGSDANLFVGSMSFVAHAITRQLAERIGALLLDSANGEDLDRYAFDRYQLLRKGAAPAVTRVRFYRASLTGGDGVVPSGTPLKTLSGIDYITLEDASFSVTTYQVYVDVRSVLAGTAYRVGRNQIRAFAPNAQVFDASLKLTNDDPAAGAADPEQDDEFKERVRSFWLSARRGTLAAIEFGATTVPGVASASASEALDGTSRPARVVRLYYADDSGVSTLAMATSIDQALVEFRAAGIAVVYVTSVPQVVPVVLSLTFLAGVDTAGITQNIVAAMYEFINSNPVNGNLSRQQLLSVLQRFQSAGLVPSSNSLVAPAGDLIAQPGTTFRTTRQSISVL